MDKERKKIDLEPKTMEEKKMREAFEQWYHSRFLDGSIRDGTRFFHLVNGLI